MLSDPDRANFETLLRAAENDNLALMEVTDTESGEQRAAICAVHFENGEVVFTPLGLMVWFDPYERLQPPEEA